MTDGRHATPDVLWAGGDDFLVSDTVSRSEDDDVVVNQIRAGSEVTTWIVFDIPEGSAPRALAIAAADGGSVCLAIPGAR